MALKSSVSEADFQRALRVGRPPNIVKLFPNSRALIVSGKFIDRAMLNHGQAIAVAANARSYFVARGALQAPIAPTRRSSLKLPNQKAARMLIVR